MEEKDYEHYICPDCKWKFKTPEFDGVKPTLIGTISAIILGIGWVKTQSVPPCSNCGKKLVDDDGSYD